MSLRALSDLRASDEELFGGKSASLGELLDAGIPVPPGFAIAATAAPGGTDPEAIRSAPVPDELRAQLVEAYAALGDEQPVAVRSSAIGEDSGEATFAGQQDTYLWVRGADAVCRAVRDCWASLYNAEAVAYRKRMGIDRQPAMGVAVQLMVDADVSGVLFTCNPVSGDPSTVAVNASWGLGLAVVGGEVTPDEYRVSKVTGEVLQRTVGPKQIEYRAGESGPERAEVPAERRDAACLDDERLGELLELARRIESHFGSHQDVEWAIGRDGALYVLQSRPVTTAAPKAAAPKSAMQLVMNTFGAGKQG